MAALLVCWVTFQSQAASIIDAFIVIKCREKASTVFSAFGQRADEKTTAKVYVYGPAKIYGRHT